MCCYILYSIRSDPYYTGATQNDNKERLCKHITAAYGTAGFPRLRVGKSSWKLNAHRTLRRLEAHQKNVKPQVHSNAEAFPEMVKKLNLKYHKSSGLPDGTKECFPARFNLTTQLALPGIRLTFSS
jgi:hypothetical protein